MREMWARNKPTAENQPAMLGCERCQKVTRHQYSHTVERNGLVVYRCGVCQTPRQYGCVARQEAE